MRTTVSFGLCLACGVMLALAYPRAGVWPLAWLALVPWLVLVFSSTWPVVIIGSWLAGFAFFASLMYWVAIFGYLPWGLLALIQGAAFVLAAITARVIAPRSGWRVLAIGVAWVAWEFARSLGEFGVTWGQVGHSQASFTALAQLAAFTGVHGISFIVVAFNAAIAHSIVARGQGRRAHVPLVGAAALAAAAVGLGWAHAALTARALDAESHPAVRVGVAQASLKTWLTVEQLNAPLTLEQQHRELATYVALTRQAAARGAQVVIWPESAVPGYLEYDYPVRETVLATARELGVWLIVGGPAFETGREYNSIYVISPQGVITTRYDKVHLVPFGEYVPWRKYLPLLRHYRVRETDVARGAGFRLLRAAGVTFGPMICFESVFPYISQREARLGARALVIITNDAWFLRTAAAAQHLQIGRFRAIEQGLYVARGAATGISAFIDPLGRVTQSLGLMQRGVLLGEIRPRAPDTLYCRVGPAFPTACSAAMLLWLVGAWARRRRKARRA